MSIEVAILLTLSGVVVGAFSALFGVGGGLLMVPLITIVLGRSQHLAEGTSLLAIIPISIAGVVAHRGRGYVSLRVAAWLAVGGGTTSVAGALLALSVPSRTLRLLFAFLIAAIAVFLIYQGIRERRSTLLAPRPGPEDESG
jgi:uncharacterized membrane protein YfcA